MSLILNRVQHSQPQLCPTVLQHTSPEHLNLLHLRSASYNITTSRRGIRTTTHPWASQEEDNQTPGAECLQISLDKLQQGGRQDCGCKEVANWGCYIKVGAGVFLTNVKNRSTHLGGIYFPHIQYY